MIHADFETKSAYDLIKGGAYNYAAHPTTDVNCLSWAFDNDDPFIWFPGDTRPLELIERVQAGELFAAWNAQFERLIWNWIMPRYGFPTIPLEQFYCIAALSRARGFPGALEKAARFANLPAQKDMEGHRLMMKLCKPRRVEEDGTIVWWDDERDYERLGEYCIQDVKVERAMFDLFIPFTDQELSDYHLSEEINDRGVMVDLAVARAAVDGAAKEKLTSDDAMRSLTGIDSCTKVAQIKAWVESEWREIPDLNKTTINDLLLEDDIPPLVAEVLELRRDNAKAAVGKFDAMLARSDIDGIVRGLFMFRGAGQTGRFSSIGLQFQNLIAECMPEAIPVLLKHGIKGLRMLGDPIQILTKLVRPSVIAAPGKTFLIGDFAQIEARITAWLAGETDLLNAFRLGMSPYSMFGQEVTGREIDKHKTPQDYKVFKACILGLGFGGGEGALARSLKKENIVVPLETRKEYVDAYRNRYTKIKALWYRLRDAVLMAYFSPGTMVQVGPVHYMYDGEHLWCRLPSGRLMCYPYVRLAQDDFGEDCLEYKRGNRAPKAGVMEWPHVRIWHGLTMENLAQAIAFDLLMAALRRLRKWGVRVHVHDEIVVEVDEDKASALVPEFEKLMTELEPWAEGLPLAAEVQISDRYKK